MLMEVRWMSYFTASMVSPVGCARSGEEESRRRGEKERRRRERRRPGDLVNGFLPDLLMFFMKDDP
jgi:hypothetical protein